jgi:hypothetical protein
VIVDFDARVSRWDARADSSWFFATLPPDLSELIREIPRPVRGFGSVRVRARVGQTEWTTSIFPSSGGTFVLPLKKSVRDAESLVDEGPLSVRLEVLDA